MSLRNKNGLAVLLRVVILFCSYFALQDMIHIYQYSFLGAILYYANFSFLLIAAVTVVYLIFGFRTRITGSTRIPRAMQIVRFAVAVTAVFALVNNWTVYFLTPDQQNSLTLYPILIYGLIPVLFLTDFLAFDKGTPMDKLDLVPAMGPPLLFAFFTFLYVTIQYTGYTYNDHPYYFFFSDLGSHPVLGMYLGVEWTILILFGSTFLIACLLRWIQLKTIKPEPEEA